ncbi:hypothetical protein ACQY0O_002074 [Thecaphora frezii]
MASSSSSLSRRALKGPMARLAAQRLHLHYASRHASQPPMIQSVLPPSLAAVPPHLEHRPWPRARKRVRDPRIRDAWDGGHVAPPSAAASADTAPHAQRHASEHEPNQAQARMGELELEQAQQHAVEGEGEGEGKGEAGRPSLSRKQRAVEQTNRTAMIMRLMVQGRIVSAMSGFVSDVEAGRKPFSSREYEWLMLTLRRVISCKRHMRPRKASSAPMAERLRWRPAVLGDNVDPRSLPLENQCLIAMAELWDSCIAHGCLPTNRTVSALMATYTDYLAPDHLLQTIHLALRAILDGADDAQRDAQLRNLSLGVVTSLVTACGKARKPELAHHLLDQWARARCAPSLPTAPQAPTFAHLVHRINATAVAAGDAPFVEAAKLPDICLAEWTQSLPVWMALLQSRISTGDIPGAEAWLERYRLIASLPHHLATEWKLPKFQRSPDPYVLLMRAYEPAGDVWSQKVDRHVSQKVRTVLEALNADDVPLDADGVVFAARFLADADRIDESLNLLQQHRPILGLDPLDRDWPSLHLFKTLFQLYRQVSRTDPLSGGHGRRAQLASLLPLRQLIGRLFHAGSWQKVGRAEDAHRYRDVALINDALAACLYQRDFPAAAVLLRTFHQWGLEPDMHTHLAVIRGLVEAEVDLVGDDGASPAQADKVKAQLLLSADEVLAHLSAQDGMSTRQREDRDTLQLLKQTLMFNACIAAERGEPLSTVSYGFPPGPRPLRPVDHLVSLLRRAMIAEVERVREGGGGSGVVAAAPAAAVWTRDLVSLEVASLDVRRRQEETPEQCLASEAYRRARQEIMPYEQWAAKRARENPEKPVGRKLRSSSRPRTPRSSSSSGGKAGPTVRHYSSAACSVRSGGTTAEGGALEHAHLPAIRVEHLPHQVPYSLGLALQEHLVAERAAARSLLRSLPAASPASSSVEDDASVARARTVAATDTLLLLEHKPVYTEGRREEQEDEAVARALRKLGADYHVTKRGGQITYHGPGQLVGYPILDLGAMGLSTRCYVDRIQESLRGVLERRYGLSTVEPPDGHTGVWADEYHKIASIGIQVRHRITSHGFALNVEERSMRRLEGG